MFDKMAQMSERTVQTLSRRQFVQRIGGAAAVLVAALSGVRAEAATGDRCDQKLPNTCPAGTECRRNKRGAFHCKRKKKPK